MFGFLILTLSSAMAQTFTWPTAPVTGDPGMLASFDPITGDPVYADPDDIVLAAVDECSVLVDDLDADVTTALGTIDSEIVILESEIDAIPLPPPIPIYTTSSAITSAIAWDEAGAETTGTSALADKLHLGRHYEETGRTYTKIMAHHTANDATKSMVLMLYTMDAGGRCKDLIWAGASKALSPAGAKVWNLATDGTWYAAAGSLRDASDHLALPVGVGVCKGYGASNAVNVRTIGNPKPWGRPADLTAAPYACHRAVNTGSLTPLGTLTYDTGGAGDVIPINSACPLIALQ